ncbi:hypothetical protein Tco_0970963 [Tanacetum coccineum]
MAMPNVDIPQGMDTGGSPRCQETMGGALAQTRSKRVLEKPNEPPLLEGHTSGSGEGSMEHTFELMDTVPPTPHDSPLTRGYTPGSDEGRLKLKELMAICTKIVKIDSDFDVLDDDMEDVKGETVHTATTRVSAVSAVNAPVTTDGVAISTAEPRIPSTTVATSFIDEDLTIAQTLIKMKEEKAKEKGVTFKDGVLVEEEPEKPEKVKRRDQGLAQIESDAELAERLHEEELAELDRAQKERQKQEEATSAALAEEFDEIQARIDADHELAVRLTHEEQEKYTIEERARLLAEFFKRRKKQLAAERAEAIRNKPPTRTQKLYEREKRWIDDFKPIDDDSQQQAESTKKRQRANSEEESSKKQKLEEDNDAEKEELRDSMDVVPKDDVAIDVESLATKYPSVDWKTHILNENMMYYQIIRADRSSKNYKIFSEMLDDFDRQDVMDLHRLVQERYDTTSLEGYHLLLWGDLKTLFEPNEENEIWKNQQDYNLINWRLFDSCGVHVLLMNTRVAIHMMIEKKYPLTQEMLSRMLHRRLEVDYESEMAFELLRFTRSQLQKKIEPTTVEEKWTGGMRLKSSGTMLMALHQIRDQLKFHSYKDAKLHMRSHLRSGMKETWIPREDSSEVRQEAGCKMVKELDLIGQKWSATIVINMVTLQENVELLEIRKTEEERIIEEL